MRLHLSANVPTVNSDDIGTLSDIPELFSRQIARDCDLDILMEMELVRLMLRMRVLRPKYYTHILEEWKRNQEKASRNVMKCGDSNVNNKLINANNHPISIELTEDIAIALLKGTIPSYEVIDSIPEDLGHYIGRFVDSWQWNDFGTDIPYTTKELYDLYLICKN